MVTHHPQGDRDLDRSDNNNRQNRFSRWEAIFGRGGSLRNCKSAGQGRR